MLIGSFQILALFAGISRSGVTMVGGLWRGLSHEDAARFAFLLATPVILAAGVLKIPSLFGQAGEHIHGQVAVGFVLTGITAYFSVRLQAAKVRVCRHPKGCTPRRFADGDERRIGSGSAPVTPGVVPLGWHLAGSEVDD